MIDQAWLATGGGGVAPDATFPPRPAFGTVRGYRWYGADMPAQTTLGEAFALDRPEGANQLPDRWRAAKSRLNTDLPLDVVADLDMVGRNSGSPVVNRSSEVVGLFFAGNDAAEHNTCSNGPATARGIWASWSCYRGDASQRLRRSASGRRDHALMKVGSDDVLAPW